MIGTDEAKEAASYTNQLIQCASIGVPSILYSIPKIGPMFGNLAHWANVCVCPAQMYDNLDNRLYSLAHARLGYKEYAGPFGIKDDSSEGSWVGPGIQMDMCGYCQYCLIYDRLKNMPDSSVPASLENSEKPQAMGWNPFSDDAEKTKGWMRLYMPCTNDLIGCAMFTCGACTCGITSCIATCEMGKLIGTEEAIEHTSFMGQFIGCLTHCIPCMCFCEMFIPKFMSNYQLTLLHMTKAKLGKKHFPAPAGLPLVPGAQMSHPCLAPCTMCLLLAELKKSDPDGMDQPLMGNDSKDSSGDPPAQTTPPTQMTNPTTGGQDETKKDSPAQNPPAAQAQTPPAIASEAPAGAGEEAPAGQDAA